MSLELEGGLSLWSFARLVLERWLGFTFQSSHGGFDLLIALRDFVLVDLVKLESLAQSEEMLLAPVAFECQSDLRHTLLDSAVLHRGQLVEVCSPPSIAPMMAIPLTPVISVTA